MSKSNRLVGKLKRAMEDEIHVFDDFILQEESLNKLIKERDWGHVEAAFDKLSRTADRIESSEEKRSRLCGDLQMQLGLSEGESFGALLARLPSSLRKDLEEPQQSIKKRLLKVKSVSNGLIYYLRCMQESAGQIIDAVFPYRKGKLYSNDGRATQSSNGPVMVNHNL
jgi:hypothetical protein